ncbi:MAG TPA: cyclase family protein [Clostridiales bacterium]|nr:cyclase family protein [Clostridiales bacterium]
MMRLIDISHILNEDTPIYPGDYKTSLQKYATLEKDSYCSYLLSSCLHTGTHIDFPMHLTNDDRAAADFSLDNFAGKGVLLDARGENPICMKSYYKEMVPEGCIVLLYTGFDRYYNEKEYFTHHPEVSNELAEFLISRKIKMLGMDMPSPDYPPFTVHKALLSNDIFILENVTNLHELLDIKSFEVMAFPLKISAEASFVRAVCKHVVK